MSPYFVFSRPFDSSGLDTERQTQKRLNIQYESLQTVFIWFIMTEEQSWQRYICWEYWTQDRNVLTFIEHNVLSYLMVI